jgi:hypothetical protein
MACQVMICLAFLDEMIWENELGKELFMARKELAAERTVTLLQ